jgi:hypothetical protein
LIISRCAAFIRPAVSVSPLTLLAALGDADGATKLITGGAG